MKNYFLTIDWNAVNAIGTLIIAITAVLSALVAYSTYFRLVVEKLWIQVEIAKVFTGLDFKTKIVARLTLFHPAEIKIRNYPLLVFQGKKLTIVIPLKNSSIVERPITLEVSKNYQFHCDFDEVVRALNNSGITGENTNFTIRAITTKGKIIETSKTTIKKIQNIPASVNAPKEIRIEAWKRYKLKKTDNKGNVFSISLETFNKSD